MIEQGRHVRAGVGDEGGVLGRWPVVRSFTDSTFVFWTVALKDRPATLFRSVPQPLVNGAGCITRMLKKGSLRKLGRRVSGERWMASRDAPSQRGRAGGRAVVKRHRHGSDSFASHAAESTDEIWCAGALRTPQTVGPCRCRNCMRTGSSVLILWPLGGAAHRRGRMYSRADGRRKTAGHHTVNTSRRNARAASYTPGHLDSRGPATLSVLSPAKWGPASHRRILAAE